MENGKKNGGCLVGCLVVAGLSWMLFSIALVVSVVLMASLCEGSGSSVKFGKSRMSSGISSPEEEDLPSCRLVTPQEDESLFSLAKRTHSSPALIAEANGLDSENPAPGGKLLLIPVIRAK